MPRVPKIVQINNAQKNYYFDNAAVEHLMLQYKWTGCTDIELRNQIMAHSNELIEQVIRTHKLHKICTGSEGSAFMDSFQTAWIQIEKTLYKYKSRIYCADCYNPQSPQKSCIFDPAPADYDIPSPEEIVKLKLKSPCTGKIPTAVVYKGTSKLFNMWSQVSRTAILAYIKKEGRDYKNSDPYKDHLNHKYKSISPDFEDFINEVRGVCKHNETHIKIVDSLVELVSTDDRPYDGIISKLSKISGESRAQVINFLKIVRLRNHEFTFTAQKAPDLPSHCGDTRFSDE